MQKALRSWHALLVKVPATRRWQRRFTRRVKQVCGVPDAYGDLFHLARQHDAAAILDVGAFHGSTVVRFLDELLLPVHAFEPTPDSFAALQDRFKDNAQVQLHNVALADSTGTAKFHCSSNKQMNSLLQNDDDNLKNFPAFTDEQQEIEVRTQTLDDWIGQHIPEGKLIIKCDVQGAEGKLLDGAGMCFAERVLAFYSEAQIQRSYVGQTDFFQLHQRLANEFGFTLGNIYPGLNDSAGRAVQLDALWLNNRWLGS